MRLFFAWLVVVVAPVSALTRGVVPARRRLWRRTVTCSAVERVEVCQNKHCRKRGAAKTLKLFQALAGEATVVQAADMSHTEHGCFDMCVMGPNVRINGTPRTDEGRVKPGVKTAADVAAVLGIDIDDDWTLPAAAAAV
eukprot:CAMPEP_0197413728 /NCGR_PEP_ID=MMETSP1170-20131217/563_1 /TAXON_ID=54406 /ORGANISM="Sarcinochrysis sp, Strain CCMP770" /LENGTH=138 /DNA_ID=CAMNT_0042940357 /DNA_START=14 /DNA_END=430 /DNA_ORIENTATION=+